MKISNCMGNPSVKAQCEKCARLPHNRNDEDEAVKWLDWKKMAAPCKEFVEVKSE
jgi:hypothetical protein